MFLLLIDNNVMVQTNSITDLVMKKFKERYVNVVKHSNYAMHYCFVLFIILSLNFTCTQIRDNYVRS